MIARRTAFDGEKAFGHLEHLAVEIGPRLTGTAGEHKAAKYIAREFTSFGLKVSRQRFDSLTYDNSACTFAVRQGGRWRAVDAEPVMLSASTRAGGIEAELYDARTGQAEYLTPAMKDKIVLMCGELTPENRHRVVSLGARAVVFIDPVVRENLRRTVLWGQTRTTYGNVPMATIRHKDGLEIVRRGEGRGRLVLRNSEKTSYSLNVIGEKAGTDLADEIIIVCAHYDSHWQISGASDNAAGTGIMMEIARVLAGRPSRRTLRFIAFAAEETGLHGSTFYANTLAANARRDRRRASFDEGIDTTECDRHRMTFNIDVHGSILGSFKATYNGPDDVGASVRLLAREVGMPCEVKSDPWSSDGTAMAAIGIPNVQFFRSGGTGTYGHQTGDEIRYLSAGALGEAGAFVERYLRRYVTDAAAFPFVREIPADQMKDIVEYFHRKGRLPVPGAEDAKKPAARRAGARRKK